MHLGLPSLQIGIIVDTYAALFDRFAAGPDGPATMQVAGLTVHMRLPCFAICTHSIFKVLILADEAGGGKTDMNHLGMVMKQTRRVEQDLKELAEVHAGSAIKETSDMVSTAVVSCIADLVKKAAASLDVALAKHIDVLKEMVHVVDGEAGAYKTFIVMVEQADKMDVVELSAQASELLKDKDIKKMNSAWKSWDAWRRECEHSDVKTGVGQVTYTPVSIGTLKHARTIIANMNAIQAIWSHKLGPSQTRADLCLVAKSAVATLPALGDTEAVIHEKLSLAMSCF